MRGAPKPAGWFLLLAAVLLPAVAAAAPSPTPHVAVKRSARLLVIDCQLYDADGKKAATRARDLPPPQCAIYQGDREMASGSFEYG